MNAFVKKNILGIELTNATREEVLEYVWEYLKKSEKQLTIVTPNPEMVMYSRNHNLARELLNQAEIALCDGVGLFKAAWFLGKPLKERIAGTDFMDELCKQSVKNAVTVGFLGGRDGVAEKTAECLMKKYPGLRVAFIGSEWSEDGFQVIAMDPKLHAKVQRYHKYEQAVKKYTSVDILFVAFGFPKQEIWMAEHREKLPVRVMMGVGGAFDYISGGVGRAPKPVRDMGLEWLYRLIRQPWRLKRQLALPQFALLVLKEKMSSKK